MTQEGSFSGFIEGERLAKMEYIVNRRKLGKQFPSLQKVDEEEDFFLEDTLDIMELAAIELWEPSTESKPKFKQICSKLVAVAQVLPLPKDDLDKIRHMLRLITYGYLGENWEAVRRYLIENETSLEVSCECEDWNERLFRTIYMSIFYLLRKHEWQDLEKATALINKLRAEQRDFEKAYLNMDEQTAQSKALELAALYHLAKSVELVGRYHLEGQPPDITEQVNYHFDHAMNYAEIGHIIELNLIARMLKPTFNKMIANSVWTVANQVNSKVKSFVDLLVKAKPPIIEFMHPQRFSILEEGLLDPAHRAVVVNLPTSSGKTLIAEFRILQALNLFKEENGWVAYVVPTRTLVNQITLRLRKDLGRHPLNLKVEKMSGALEIDAYEYELLSSKAQFDILVTTPEKLSLLIRQKLEEALGRPLVLVVVDEAHNIESLERGINLETLLSIIKRDCQRANFLLMTPFVPNPDDLAKWLNPQNYKSINIDVHFWKPNDMVIGVFYGFPKEKGITTYFKPLITSNDTIVIDDAITIREQEHTMKASDLATKYKLTSLVASQLSHHDSILILARNKEDTYRIADFLYDHIPPEDGVQEKIKLIQKFIAAELGEQFPLVRYLDKRIGIHHAGLPDEVRCLMEELMEDRLLKYLVATTTIAQGINFDISTILMAAYSYPWTSHMPTRDFWNLAGRAGRVYSSAPGTIGIAVRDGPDSPDGLKIVGYVKEKTEGLVSSLVEMVNNALRTAREINLKELYNQPGWSMFLQYIAHMFKQSKDLGEFMAETEMTLRRTYGYGQLSNDKQQMLLEGVKKYAQSLDKGIAELSDSTGFCPETINSVIRDVRGTKLTKYDWKPSVMFSSDSNSLRKLVGIMLRTPEVKRHLKEIKIKGTEIRRFSLARLISDWVSGKEITEISRRYFGSDDHSGISECVSAIYGPLIMSATWGLSAFQRLSYRDLEYETLTDKEKKQLANLPAMVFYGVDTDEAILLRKVNVPRTVSKELGGELRSKFGDEMYKKTASDVSQWLVDLRESEWQRAVPSGKRITGKDYREIWQILSGYS